MSGDGGIGRPVPDVLARNGFGAVVALDPAQCPAWMRAGAVDGWARDVIRPTRPAVEAGPMLPGFDGGAR